MLYLSSLRQKRSSSKHRASRLHRVTLLLILLLTFFLRTYHLDRQALRGDEAASVLYSALPITELWELSRVTDPHPPLFYLMLHPWQWLAGEEAWVMRFAGVAASVLAVAALYALGYRTLHSVTSSLFAAGLLAVNPFQIWLAQDIRSYPFFTLLGLLSSGALWMAVSDQRLAVGNRSPSGNRNHLARLTPWLAYILLTVACLYIHYYTVFLIAFQGLFVLVNVRKFWGKKWMWLASQVAIGLLIIPGLRLAYNFIGQAAGGIDTIPATAIIQRTSTALLTGTTIDNVWGLWVSLLLAPIWIVGLVSLWQHNLTIGSFWSLYFAVPVLGVIALSIDRPFFKERFLIQAQPAFELLLAVGFLSLWEVSKRMSDERQTGGNPGSSLPKPWVYGSRLIPALLLALLFLVNTLALGNYFVNPAYAKAPPWQLYHSYVSSEAQPGDVMLTNFPEAAVSYYSPNVLPFYVVPVERDRSVEFRLEQTEQIAGAYKRIWFLPLLRQGFDQQGDVLDWLDRHGDRINQVFFPVYHLNLYLSPPTVEAKMISQPTTFAHGIHLRGFQIFDATGASRLQEVGEVWMLTLEPDEAFSLSLYWLADGPTDTSYTVFTHLIAADGFNRANQDNQPVWGTYPTTNWQPGERVTDKYTLTIPPGTPAGDHKLQIGWYDSETQERVPVLDNAGQPTTNRLTLDAIIRVE